MNSLSDILKTKGRYQLASILEQYGSSSVVEYSSHLYDYQVPCDIEPELLQAFQGELQRLDCNTTELKSILKDLQHVRILQTSTHLTASEGPTFFAIHWLAGLGLSIDQYYIIGAFSGIPFSNSAWSGCLNYSSRYKLEHLLAPQSPVYYELLRAEKDRGRDTIENRISLIPGQKRDALVYRSIIAERSQHILPYLCEQLKSLLPVSNTDGSYTKWALQLCGNLGRHLFPKKRIVYLDLNEVITHYLQMVLNQPAHPVYRLLFDSSIQIRILEQFGQGIPIFTVPCVEKKKEKLVKLTIQDGFLQGGPYRILLTPETIIKELEAKQLCPGVFVTFMVLSFLNGFKCLGSFEQIEYLKDFQEKWTKISLLNQEIVKQVATDGLTTGRLTDETELPVFPLDIVLGTPWDFPDKATLQDLINPLLPRLGRRKQ
ncbi:MAG: hypothetical protein HQM14_06310 [SAR324 cluster bacterium]|nr:hypothetical protein [SAR324 cluster bacterium]